MTELTSYSYPFFGFGTEISAVLHPMEACIHKLWNDY